MPRPLAMLFAADVMIEELDLAEPFEARTQLTPAELAIVAGAIPSRQREFTAGRILARRAAARLGVALPTLLSGPDRAPIWPEALVGSITHTRNYCGVAVARRSRGSFVGVDVELDEPLCGKLWDRVCTVDEVSWLRTLPADSRGRFAKLLWCAKEAGYKAQYPLTRTFLDFRALSVKVDVTAGQWEAALRIDIAPWFASGDRICGRWSGADGLLAAAAEVAIPAGAPVSAVGQVLGPGRGC